MTSILVAGIIFDPQAILELGDSLTWKSGSFHPRAAYFPVPVFFFKRQAMDCCEDHLKRKTGASLQFFFPFLSTLFAVYLTLDDTHELSQVVGHCSRPPSSLQPPFMFYELQQKPQTLYSHP